MVLASRVRFIHRIEYGLSIGQDRNFAGQGYYPHGSRQRHVEPGSRGGPQGGRWARQGAGGGALGDQGSGNGLNRVHQNVLKSLKTLCISTRILDTVGLLRIIEPATDNQYSILRIIRILRLSRLLEYVVRST